VTSLSVPDSGRPAWEQSSNLWTNLAKSCSNVIRRNEGPNTQVKDPLNPLVAPAVGFSVGFNGSLALG
jgi:hypothetical protein